MGQLVIKLDTKKPSGLPSVLISLLKAGFLQAHYSAGEVRAMIKNSGKLTHYLEELESK